MNADARVADVAGRWVEARENVRRLKEVRAACLCERAEPVSWDDYAEAAEEQRRDPIAVFEFPQPTQETPCWKWFGEPDEDGRRTYQLAEAEWCATCQRRHAINAELRQAVRHHAAMLRGLVRSAKARTKHREESLA